MSAKGIMAKSSLQSRVAPPLEETSTGNTLDRMNRPLEKYSFILPRDPKKRTPV